MDVLKWDAVHSHIRQNYLRDNMKQIKSFSLKNNQLEVDDETKCYVENLVITIKLKPTTSALLDIMDVKADEAYGCHLQISIEESAYDPGKLLLRTTDRTTTPDNGERTPMKRRVATPLPKPKLRNLPSRRYNADAASDDESEYKPTNDNQKGAIVPEYVPSASANDMAMTEHQEYRPEPLNGNANDNLLQYTPTNTRTVKRRSENTQSPTIIPSTKKKRQDVIHLSDSQESLVDTLDNVSISGKPSNLGNSSQQDLFGPDSDNEGKNEEKDSSFDALQKKYGSMETPPAEKKATQRRMFGGGGGLSKPGPSTGTSSKSKSLRPKKEANSNFLQTSIDKWTNKNTVYPKTSEKTDTRKPENRKTRKALEREAEIASKITAMQKKKERIDAEREEIEQTNNFLHQQIEQQQQRPIPIFDEKLPFPTLSLDDLERKFELYRTDLSKLIKTVKKGQKAQRSLICNHVFRLIDHELLLEMSEVLHTNFSQEFHNLSSHDKLVSDLLIPEWVLMIFRDEHNLDENEARERIIWQSNEVNACEDEEEFMS